MLANQCVRVVFCFGYVSLCFYSVFLVCKFTKFLCLFDYHSDRL